MLPHRLPLEALLVLKESPTLLDLLVSLVLPCFLNESTQFCGNLSAGECCSIRLENLAIEIIVLNLV